MVSGRWDWGSPVRAGTEGSRGNAASSSPLQVIQGVQLLTSASGPLNVTSHYSDLTSPLPPPPSSHFYIKNPALKHTQVSQSTNQASENQSLLPQTTKHLKWQHQGGSPYLYICTCCQLWNLMIVLTHQLPLACFQGPLQQAANCSVLVPPSHTPSTKPSPSEGASSLLHVYHDTATAACHRLKSHL